MTEQLLADENYMQNPSLYQHSLSGSNNMLRSLYTQVPTPTPIPSSSIRGLLAPSNCHHYDYAPNLMHAHRRVDLSAMHSRLHLQPASLRSESVARRFLFQSQTQRVPGPCSMRHNHLRRRRHYQYPHLLSKIFCGYRFPVQTYFQQAP